MVLWFGAYLVLPLNAGLERIAGHSLPIGLLIWGAAAVALAFATRGDRRELAARETDPGFDRDALILTLSGGASILTVALAYSSGSHLGALGLDTHQHIYWTAQILDAQHLPLVERDTTVLSLYPKAFHILTANWSAAGAVGPLGPWIKLMPFLQAFLPCMVFAELIRARAALGSLEPGRSRALTVLLSFGLLFYAFAFTRMAYPEYDLGGTPRFASGAALMFPYLLFAAGSALKSDPLRRLGWAALPATALLLLALNAVLLLQLAVFVVPLMIITQAFERDVSGATAAPRSGRQVAWTVALALALPIAISLGDPWIVAQWSIRLGAVGQGFLDLVGVVTPDQAASLGLLSTDELVVEKPGAIRYSGPGELVRLFAGSLAAGVGSWLTTGLHFPFMDDLFSDPGRIAVRLAIPAAVATALVSRRIAMRDRTTGSVSPADNAPMRVWLGIAIGVGFGGFAQIALVHFSEGLAAGRGYEFVLLRQYCEIAIRHVGLVAMAMVLLASIGWAVAAFPSNNAIPAFIGEKAWLTPLLALLAAALPFLLYGQTETVDPDKSFWGPVTSSDLADLRAIEAHIGDTDGVMAPSNTWRIDGESWIIPQGKTAGILPFTTRRVLFNSRLGAGVQFNWRDLAAFCRGTRQHRAQFLQRNDVRWFLLKGKGSGTRSAMRKFRMCKLELSELGVTFPPAHQQGNLSLYRIDPKSIARPGR